MGCFAQQRAPCLVAVKWLVQKTWSNGQMSHLHIPPEASRWGESIGTVFKTVHLKTTEIFDAVPVPAWCPEGAVRKRNVHAVSGDWSVQCECKFSCLWNSSGPGSRSWPASWVRVRFQQKEPLPHYFSEGRRLRTYELEALGVRGAASLECASLKVHVGVPEWLGSVTYVRMLCIFPLHTYVEQPFLFLWPVMWGAGICICDCVPTMSY